MSLRWVNNILLLLGVIAVFIVAMVIGSQHDPGEEEAFAGTDAAVTTQLEEEGYEPWFQPLFSPASGEIESGLFALQAAIGGGALGYCFGAMRRRTVTARTESPTPAP